MLFDQGRRISQLIKQFEEKEKLLLQMIPDLPEDWYLQKNFVELIKDVERTLAKKTKKLSQLDFARFERAVNPQFDRVLDRLERYLFQVDSLLRSDDKNMRQSLADAVQRLAESAHALEFLLKGFPVTLIANKRVWGVLLKGLRTGYYLPPDIDVDAATKMIRAFANIDVVALVKYRSTEEPYLLVGMKNGEIQLHIIKRGDIRRGLLISKLMYLLGARRMVLDHSHMLVDDRVEHLNRIEYIKGKSIIGIDPLKDLDEILRFAYYLGAAMADAFVMNLSDRHINIYIDRTLFSGLVRKKNWKDYIGIANPIFNIDYDFLNYDDPQGYLNSQLYGVRGVMGSVVMNTMLVRGNGFSIAKVLNSFNEGFTNELAHLRMHYEKNKAELDDLYQRNGVEHLKARLFFNGNDLLGMQAEFVKAITPFLIERAA